MLVSNTDREGSLGGGEWGDVGGRQSGNSHTGLGQVPIGGGGGRGGAGAPPGAGGGGGGGRRGGGGGGGAAFLLLAGLCGTPATSMLISNAGS